jgi:hypothetical protein
MIPEETSPGRGPQMESFSLDDYGLMASNDHFKNFKRFALSLPQRYQNRVHDV